MALSSLPRLSAFKSKKRHFLARQAAVTMPTEANRRCAGILARLRGALGVVEPREGIGRGEGDEHIFASRRAETLLSFRSIYQQPGSVDCRIGGIHPWSFHCEIRLSTQILVAIIFHLPGRPITRTQLNLGLTRMPAKILSDLNAVFSGCNVSAIPLDLRLHFAPKNRGGCSLPPVSWLPYPEFLR
jgi:hypothetical protein